MGCVERKRQKSADPSKSSVTKPLPRPATGNDGVKAGNRAFLKHGSFALIYRNLHR